MNVLIWIVLVVAALLAVAYGLSFAARRQVDTVVMARPDDVVAAIDEGFSNGLLWRPVHGPGTWNFECRGIGISSMAIKTKPVISIDASDHGAAGVLVQMWMSSWGSSYGQVGSADRVVFKRRKVIRQLKRLSAGAASSQPQMGQQSPGAPTSTGTVPSAPPTPSPRPADGSGPGSSGFGAPPGLGGVGPAMPATDGRPTPTFGPGSGTPGGYRSQGGGFAPPPHPRTGGGPQFGGGIRR